MYVQELVDKYLASRAFINLSRNTQMTYRVSIRKSGILDKRIEDITFEFTDELYADIARQRGPAAANMTVTVFKKIWFWGYRREYTVTNPWWKMDTDAPVPRDVVWTAEQIDTFIKTAMDKGKPHIALLVTMCYYLSQRPSDILALQWRSYKDGWLTIMQSKTSQIVSLPVPEPLKSMLDGLPYKDKYIVTRDHMGEHVSYSSAAHSFKRLRKQAGLPENLTMRDLRRTGLTELGEYGLTEDQIRSISGHKSRAVLNTYVRIRDKIAEGAIKQRFGDATGNIYNDPFYKDGQTEFKFRPRKD